MRWSEVEVGKGAMGFLTLTLTLTLRTSEPSDGDVINCPGTLATRIETC